MDEWQADLLEELILRLGFSIIYLFVEMKKKILAGWWLKNHFTKTCANYFVETGFFRELRFLLAAFSSNR